MAMTARPDPIRNFKFNVQAVLTGEADPFADMGFMSVEGIAMNTEMVAYREGGWNTSPHKLPGQTDFSPLTMSTGVYYNKPQLWNLARKMFSVQHGAGTLGMSQGAIDEFRYDLVVRVLGHPVTVGKPLLGRPREDANHVPSAKAPVSRPLVGQLPRDHLLENRLRVERQNRSAHNMRPGPRR